MGSSVEGAYSIINNYDPRENRWYNDTGVDIPQSSIIDEIVAFFVDNFILIFMAILFFLILFNFVTCFKIRSLSRRNVPLRVKREAKRTIGVPYNRGFDKHQEHIIPEGSVIEMKVVSKEDETTVTTERFVLSQPVYINHVVPPKHKE